MKTEELRSGEKIDKPQPRTEKSIRHHFRHYPKEAQDTAVEYLLAPFKKGRTRENLSYLIKCILEHYSPANEVADNIDFASLGEDSELVNDFGIDSLSLMEISFFIEESFGLRIEGEKLPSIVTLGDAIDMVGQITEVEEAPADSVPQPLDRREVDWPSAGGLTAFMECNAPVINVEGLESAKKLKKTKDK